MSVSLIFPNKNILCVALGQIQSTEYDYDTDKFSWGAVQDVIDENTGQPQRYFVSLGQTLGFGWRRPEQGSIFLAGTSIDMGDQGINGHRYRYRLDTRYYHALRVILNYYDSSEKEYTATIPTNGAWSDWLATDPDSGALATRIYCGPYLRLA